MSAVFNIDGPIRLRGFSSDPSGAENGYMYYNSSANKLRIYSGGSFVEAADLSILASTANGEGASLVGIEDANARFAATTVEAALDEAKQVADSADSAITGHLDGTANKHDASELDFEDNATSAKNLSAGSVEAALTSLDNAIGDLTFVPSNYTDPGSDIVAAHLQNIDAALATAGGTEFDDATFKITDDAGDGFGILFDVSAATADRTVTAPDANVDLGEVNTSIQQDGSRAFSADQSMGGNKITNLATPTADTDAATKAYVDAIKQGLDVKQSVRAATTASVDLASMPSSIDGVTLSNGDRFLAKDQSTASENGIYIFNGAASAATRSADADEDSEVTAGMFTFVEEGTSHADSGWVLATNDPITVGTTGLSFTQFSGAGQVTAGDGLSKSGNTLSVNVDDSTIEIATDTLRLKDLGITNAKIAAAAAIDATKIADGSISNTEFQHLDGLTSNIQTQLDAKLANIVEDTTPQLGGNLDVNGNDIEDASNDITIAPNNKLLRAKQASKTDFIEEEYIHGINLTSSQTDTTITALTFAHATYEGVEIVYRLKDSTSGAVRIGTIRVATDGTTAVLNDVYTDTAGIAVTFSATVSAGDVLIQYSSGANASVMRADVKRIKA